MPNLYADTSDKGGVLAAQMPCVMHCEPFERKGAKELDWRLCANGVDLEINLRSRVHYCVMRERFIKSSCRLRKHIHQCEVPMRKVGQKKRKRQKIKGERRAVRLKETTQV